MGLGGSYPLRLGAVDVIYYGLGLTEADVIMSDGTSLEHIGATSEELLLPNAADMATRR